ncbi:MAG: hypothetical protein NZM25_05685 [Leptospiraceae bacterium]|nr:hypothetical protein [Leptospiraceae bacterium]MDW8306538.1 hypothetical protein [Leptospiraceae bacterium]
MLWIRFLLIGLTTKLIIAQEASEIHEGLEKKSERIGKWFSSFEITAQTLLLVGKEHPSWAEGRLEGIRSDIFLAQSPYYRGELNISSQAKSISQGALLIEALFGLQLPYIPGFQKIRGSEKVRSVRLGGHLYVAPFGGRTTINESRSVTFFDIPQNQSEIFIAKIKTVEDSLVVSPGISLFYFHEGDLGRLSQSSFLAKQRLIPFAGLQMGLGIVSAKRKTSMETNLVPEGLLLVQNKATLQENFINDLGLRFAFMGGIQYQVEKSHLMELRLGYQLLSFEANMVRVGNFTQEKRDPHTGSTVITYSRDVLDKNVVNEFSHSGFFLTLGYTVALF